MYGFFYQLIMRIAHKFNWHYAPPIYPEGDTQLWCKWCGFRQTIRRGHPLDYNEKGDICTECLNKEKAESHIIKHRFKNDFRFHVWGGFFNTEELEELRDFIDKIVEPEHCRVCNGSGKEHQGARALPEYKYKTCSGCDGTGKNDDFIPPNDLEKAGEKNTMEVFKTACNTQRESFVKPNDTRLQ